MINIVVALQVEALALIEHYRLNGQSMHGFTVYQNERMRLIVSGSGKVNSAAAAATLFALNDYQRDDVWLNLGIAGHDDAPVGRVFLVDDLLEASTGKRQLPYVSFAHEQERAALCCVDVMEQEYQRQSLYDMESWGFYLCACRYSSAELVQVMKVVSDNRENVATASMDKTQIVALIRQAIPVIDSFLFKIEEHAAMLNSSESLSQYRDSLQHWRFTESEKRQLEDMLQRLLVLQMGSSVDALLYQREQNKKQLLQALQALVKQAVVKYGCD